MFSNISDTSFLKLILYLFNMFGLVTFSIDSKLSKHEEPIFVASTLSICYNLFFIAVVNALNVLTVIILYMTRYKKTLSLIHIADFFEIIYGTFVSLLISWHYCLCQKSSIKLMTKIYRAKFFANQLTGITMKKSSLTCIVTVLIVYLLLFIALLVSGIKYFGELVYLFSTSARNFIITFLVLQYALIMKILLDVFTNLNDALFNLIKAPKSDSQCREFQRSILVNTKQLQLLSSVRDLHYNAVEACQEVGKFYEIMVLASIAYMSVCMTVYSFFLADLIIERRIFITVIEYVHIFLYLVCFISSFVILSRYVTTTTQEVCNFIFDVC